MGRFISSDTYPSTGQGPLGNNMFAYCNNNPVNGTDPTGETALFLLANATFGAIVGAVTQVSTNIITGNAWNSGIIGAALGGAVYNSVALLTGGNILAASASAGFVEAATNETMEYTSGRKQLSASNIMSSISTVLCKAADSTLTAAITGKAASNIVKTNSGWFQPKKFISSFTGKYAQKVFLQTAVQGEMTMFYNAIKSVNQEIYAN